MDVNVAELIDGYKRLTDFNLNRAEKATSDQADIAVSPVGDEAYGLLEILEGRVTVRVEYERWSECLTCKGSG